MNTLALYLILCVISFIANAGVFYFEHYMLAKYFDPKADTVTFDITVVDIIALTFLTAMSFIGVAVAAIYLVMLLAILASHIVVRKVNVKYNWIKNGKS